MVLCGAHQLGHLSRYCTKWTDVCLWVLLPISLIRNVELNQAHQIVRQKGQNVVDDGTKLYRHLYRVHRTGSVSLSRTHATFRGTDVDNQIWTMAFSPDDKQLAVGGDAGDVLIYDM